MVLALVITITSAQAKNLEETNTIPNSFDSEKIRLNPPIWDTVIGQNIREDSRELHATHKSDLPTGTMGEHTNHKRQDSEDKEIRRTKKRKGMGAYFSGNFGYSVLSDSDLSVFEITFATLSFDPGFNVGGALGYDYGDVRAEIEWTIHSWDIDTGNIPGVIGGVAIVGCPCTGTIGGDVLANSFMVNGYYDFEMGNSSVEPYFGAGWGLSNVNAEIGGLGSDSAIVFSYQAMVGMGFKINRTMTLTAGYRYFGTTDPEFQLFGLPVDAEVQSHDFNLGIRVSF